MYRIFVYFFIALLFVLPYTRICHAADSTGKSDKLNKDSNTIQIDTALKTDISTLPQENLKDTLLNIEERETKLTNAKILLYILLTAGGIIIFYFFFVINLFKTLHRTRSTRQSMMLSWNSFFTVSIIWLYIVWGLVADFRNSESFTIIAAFLFILSVTMLIVSIKTK